MACESGSVPIDSLTPFSAAYLRPLLGEMSGPIQVATARGVTVTKAAVRLSDGEMIRFLKTGLDGKGVATLRFSPRVGTVPIGPLPSVPLKSGPRARVKIRAGAGLAVGFSTFLQTLGDFAEAYSPEIIAELEKMLARKVEQAERELAEEDLGVSADAMASAALATAAARDALNRKKLSRKSRGLPRVKIHGYSRAQ